MTHLKALIAALVLASVSFLAPVQAAVVSSTVAGGMDAAGEVSGTLEADPFDVVSIFTFGTYSAANRFELQREVGSPGSGVFKKVMRLDTNTANLFATHSYTAGPNGDSLRVLMTTAGTGDVQVQMTDRESAARTYAQGGTYTVMRNEFDVQTTAIPAEFYISEEEAGTGTDFAVTPTIQEGGATGVSGSGADGTDATCLSHFDTTDIGGLVSDGPIVWEVRLQSDVTTGMLEVSMTDVECNSTPVPPVDIDSGVVTFATGTFQDGVGITQHGDATALTGFVPWAAIADVELFDGGAAGTGDEVNIGTLVAATYVTLRVETDATGDCYFYVDGVLKFAGNLCVSTTARLSGMVNIDSTADGAATATAIIDYVFFAQTRPSS